MKNRAIDKEHEVNIKPVLKEDIKFIYEVSNNEEIMRIFHDKPTTLNQWQNFIEEWEKDVDEQNYIISRVCDGVEVGWLGINGLLSEDKIGWIKVIAISPDYWSCGYGRQAVEKVKAIFKSKGFRNIKLWTDACNKRARRCYESNGFVIQKIVEKKVGNLENVVDRVLMSCML